MTLKYAAVSYVLSGSNLLVVWNRRYGGWTLPGGLVEPGELIEVAQARELYEETGCGTAIAEKIYEARSEATGDRQRANMVVVFRVTIIDSDATPLQNEPDSPVGWMSREAFLKWCPFRAFYEKMFARLKTET